MEELLRLLDGGDEELLPELERHLHIDPNLGEIIQHPLVYSVPHAPAFNKMVNRQLVAKQDAIKRATDDQNWDQFIWLHERPFRVDALLEVGRHLDLPNNGPVFWRLAGLVWTDSENIWQHLDQWRDLFSDTTIPGRKHFMSEEDQETMELPSNKGGISDTFTVYRGFNRDDAVDGFSWCLNRERARWFANRWGARGRVASGLLSKRDVIGLMTGRGEAEVVAMPENVCGIEIAEA